MRSASILCSAIAARTALQRRSSSVVEMGWLMRSFAAISAFYHIDHSLQVPGEVLAHVFLDHRKREARVAVEEPALVLGDDDVLHVPEGRILGQGLLGEHVEGGAGDFPALQRVKERVLVDDASARKVDEEGGRLNRREAFGIDAVFRLGWEGREEH